VIRILIVDDHPIVRNGLRGAFADVPDIEVTGEAANGRQALAEVALAEVDRRPVDVVLMDLRMPEMDGRQAITALAQTAPQVRVLVLTTFDSESDVLPAIEAGATGYLLKDAPPEDLIRAVRAAHRGEAVLAPSVADQLIGHVRKATGTALSRRELEVLKLIADGTSNKQAAKRLFISEASIKTHLQHIYDKLDVRDRAAAVGEGYRRGLLS
jgi:DNA-binding NarL/FixJ family response regulator